MDHFLSQRELCLSLADLFVRAGLLSTICRPLSRIHGPYSFTRTQWTFPCNKRFACMPPFYHTRIYASHARTFSFSQTIDPCGTITKIYSQGIQWILFCSGLICVCVRTFRSKSVLFCFARQPFSVTNGAFKRADLFHLNMWT